MVWKPLFLIFNYWKLHTGREFLQDCIWILLVWNITIKTYKNLITFYRFNFADVIRDKQLHIILEKLSPYSYQRRLLDFIKLIDFIRWSWNYKTSSFRTLCLGEFLSNRLLVLDSQIIVVSALCKWRDLKYFRYPENQHFWSSPCQSYLDFKYF